jgi:hypothetical protein
VTQTTHTDNVLIDGSRDITQLQVEGHSTQNQPLQTWQANGATAVARVTKDGRLQTGTLGLGTPDALVEANLDNVTQPSLPKRGVQSLGKLTGALASAIDWAVHELELLGTGGVGALITALRAKVTHKNSGSSGSAELRAGDFQALNQTGTVGTPVGKATGVRGTASNTPLVSGTAYLAKAIGVEATVTNDASGTVTEAAAFEVAPPINGGTISTLYGLKVPSLSPGGTVPNYASAQLGDEFEIKVQGSAPARIPPSNFVKVYPKLVTGTPHLFAKDSSGAEFDLSGSGGGSANGELVQTEDFTQATASPLTIFTPPANAIIREVAVQVTTPAAGGSPTISIGVAGTVERDMAASESDLKTTAIYRVSPMTAVGASPAAIIATLVPSGQTFTGKVFVIYTNAS